MVYGGRGKGSLSNHWMYTSSCMMVELMTLPGPGHAWVGVSVGPRGAKHVCQASRNSGCDSSSSSELLLSGRRPWLFRSVLLGRGLFLGIFSLRLLFISLFNCLSVSLIHLSYSASIHAGVRDFLFVVGSRLLGSRSCCCCCCIDFRVFLIFGFVVCSAACGPERSGVFMLGRVVV